LTRVRRSRSFVLSGNLRLTEQKTPLRGVFRNARSSVRTGTEGAIGNPFAALLAQGGRPL